jgi:hypothetical protein
MAIGWRLGGALLLSVALAACIDTADLGVLDASSSSDAPPTLFPDSSTPDAPAKIPGSDGGTPCATNADCLAAGSFCKKALNDCLGMGACTQKPTSCPPAMGTVCDCAQVMRTSECEAALAGESVSADGICPLVVPGDAGDGPMGPVPSFEGGAFDGAADGAP